MPLTTPNWITAAPDSGKELMNGDEAGGADVINRPSKKNWDHIQQIAPGIGGTRKLIIKNGATPDEQVDVDADMAILLDTSNIPKTITSVNFTADNTASGQNGLFTGSVAANTWYAIWLTNGTSGSTSGLHPSGVLATVLGDAPSGYNDYGLLVGWIRTDATSDFLVMYQIGKYARCATGNFGTTSTTAAQTDISAYVPPGISKVYFGGGSSSNTGVTYMNPITFTSGLGNQFYNSFPGSTAVDIQGECPVETDQEVYVATNNASYTATFYVKGWELR